MHYNYALYQPGRIIQDTITSRTNKAYYESEDVKATPMTRIGDAYALHASRVKNSSAKVMDILKPHNMVFGSFLAKRTSIPVRSEPSNDMVDVQVITSEPIVWPDLLESKKTKRAIPYKRGLVTGLAVFAIGAGAIGLNMNEQSTSQASSTIIRSGSAITGSGTDGSGSSSGSNGQSSGSTSKSNASSPALISEITPAPGGRGSVESPTEQGTVAAPTVTPSPVSTTPTPTNPVSTEPTNPTTITPTPVEPPATSPSTLINDVVPLVEAIQSDVMEVVPAL